MDTRSNFALKITCQLWKLERQVKGNHFVTGPGPAGGVEATLAAEAAATAAINIRVTQPTPNHSPSGSLGSLGASSTTAGAASASVRERVPAPEAIADALESIVPQQSSSSNSDTLPSPALSNKSGMSSGNLVSIITLCLSNLPLDLLTIDSFHVKVIFL